MTTLSSFVIHSLSLLFVMLIASLNWASISFSEQIDDPPIGVTGFAVFPAIGSLITLQLSTVVLSSLVSGWVVRFLNASVIPFMVWLLVAVLSSADRSISREVSRVILQSTGVAGDLGQQQLAQSTQQDLLWIVFVVALGLNILVLLARVVCPVRSRAGKPKPSQAFVPGDLWSSQR